MKRIQNWLSARWTPSLGRSVASLLLLALLPLSSGCVTAALWEPSDTEDSPILRTEEMPARILVNAHDSVVLSVEGKELARSIPGWDPESRVGSLSLGSSYGVGIARLVRNMPEGLKADLHVLVKAGEQPEDSTKETATWSTRHVSVEIILSGRTSDPIAIAKLRQVYANIELDPESDEVSWSIRELGVRRMSAEEPGLGWTEVSGSLVAHFDCEYWSPPRGRNMGKVILTPFAVAIDLVIAAAYIVASAGSPY